MLRPDRLGDRLRAFAQPWELACFVFLPTIVVAYAASYELRNTKTLGDLPIFRTAAKAVLEGRSPYPPATPHALANFDTFVYPPAAAYLFSPIAVVPSTVAKVLMLGLGVASVLLALRLLEVEDWRCYGLASISAPVMSSLALGAFSSFLLLGAAATWRYRDRAIPGGVAAALTATVKLFLWPLGVWLLVTRRIRATAVFATATAALVLGGWAGIGFAGLGSYPHLLRVLSDVESYKSFSIAALVHVSGRPAAAVSLLLALLAIGLIGAAARTDDGGRRAFAVAVLASLVATPLVWMHYYALLFVPIALYRPRLSALWLLPLVLWLNPSTYSEGVTWRILLGLGVVAAVGTTVWGRGGAVRGRVARVRARRLGEAYAGR